MKSQSIVAFALAVIAISFLIADEVQPVGDIPVCQWHSLKRPSEAAECKAVTHGTVAEDQQAAENWTLLGLHGPQGDV